ncbi:MAG: S26 family signal peptidase [Parvibaculum sp.]
MAFSVLACAGAGRGQLHMPATPSVPFDLYMESDRPLQVGGYALVEVPSAAVDLARDRGYWAGSPVWIKRIGAIAGMHVCVAGDQLAIDGRSIGRIFAADSAGRPMPRVSLCRELIGAEVFVLGDHERSFDSRYFGLLDRSDVRSTLTPVFDSFVGPFRDRGSM